MRSRRLARFREVVRSLTPPVSILDVGGTDTFWRTVGVPESTRITLVNLEAEPVVSDGVEAVVGDGRDLSRYGDGSFDVVVSNSVIEHVGDYDDMRRFADEIRRVGQRYWVQTPNRNFPIEPHFMFPGFQFLPETAQIGLVRRWSIGSYPRIQDASAAQATVRSIRLIDAGQMTRLFPDGVAMPERLGPLTKSLIMTRGFS